MAITVTCDVPGCNAKVSPDVKVPKEHLDMFERLTGKKLKDFCTAHASKLEKVYVGAKELLGQKVETAPRAPRQKAAGQTTVAGGASAPNAGASTATPKQGAATS